MSERYCEGCGVRMPPGKARNPMGEKLVCDGCHPDKRGAPGRPVGHHGSVVTVGVAGGGGGGVSNSFVSFPDRTQAALAAYEADLVAKEAAGAERTASGGIVARLRAIVDRLDALGMAGNSDLVAIAADLDALVDEVEGSLGREAAKAASVELPPGHVLVRANSHRALDNLTRLILDGQEPISFVSMDHDPVYAISEEAWAKVQVYGGGALKGLALAPKNIDLSDYMRPIGRSSRKLAIMTRLDTAESITVLAHDSGDGATIFHCPFCGGGQVVGRSDGTVECGFCHTAFTVQVQPELSAMPQTVDGTPVPMPGMPGQPGQPGEPGDQSDPSTATDPLAPDPEDPAKKDKPKQGNPFAKGSKLYLTAQGGVLDEDAYVRHLAIAHADDRAVVLEDVRAERRA